MDTLRIKSKLEDLKNRDKTFQTFGSSHHQYKNYPVLLKEIEDFEKKYNFTLSENFRSFLIEIGYGAGPFYRIRNLKEISEHIENWFPVDYFLSPIEWIFWVFRIRPKNPFDKNRKSQPEKPFLLDQNHIDQINEKLKNENSEFLDDCGEKAIFPSNGNVIICH